MSLSRLKVAVNKARTERTELKRINDALSEIGHREQPELSQSKNGDGLLVRMYLWRATPYGHLCLVTGPAFDGQLHELVDARGKEPSGIYFPARDGNPPLTKAKRQANPQARVGKVRTDKKTGKKYVLWRPVMPDGSRPRIYLDADKPKDAELVDVIEAAEQLEASKRVIQKKETEAKRKGLRGIWKFGTGRKIVQSTPKRKPMLRASSAAPLFDSEGKEYRATYQVVATDTDGLGPVLASNLPETFNETPDYPSVFQARSLQRAGETQKIRKIAKDLDPDRLLLPHSDATLGAPVVWQGDGKTHKYGKSKVKTEKGDYYVLGGNGRTIALLMTPKDRYQSYVQRGRSLWPDLWPKGGSPDGTRNILVRVVTKPNGDPLTFAQARTLAGRTQKAASGEESPIGRAISLIRSLGIEDVTELPVFRWTGIITQDNVDDFATENRAFTEAVFDSMGSARAESYKQDQALTASLFNDLMVGYLPRKFQLEGFVSEKQERTLLTALPIMLTIHSRVRSGDIQPKWDLFPLLPSALRFSQLIKSKSDKQAIEMVEAAAAQVQLGEGTAFSEKFKSLFDELPILAVMLGIVLKKGETTRDPALTVEKYLVPYAEKALAPATSPSTAQMGVFAARGQADEGSDPAQVLADLLKIKLPRKTRQASFLNNPTRSFVAPKGAATAARRALEVRKRQPKSKKAGTRVGLARANQLANERPLSLSTVKRMKSFFDRHDGARERAARLRDPESKAAQAWGLWGGDAGRRWAESVLQSRHNPPQMLMGQLYESQISADGSHVLDLIRRRGEVGFARRADGMFPPGVDEVVEKGFAESRVCAAPEDTLYNRETCRLILTKRGKSFLRDRGKAVLATEKARQTRLFNPKGAPGYQSYSWISEDWRAVKVSSTGKIDYSQKCGAKGTQTKSGKPRLCLPLAAIKSLIRSKEGKEQLKKQARSKARAKKGERVPYLPLVKKAVSKATKDSPKDNPYHSAPVEVVSIAFDPSMFTVASADSWCGNAGMEPISMRNTGRLIVFDIRDRGMIDESTLRTIRVHPGAVAQVGVPRTGE